ncbi:MAG TPA: hypothetical protein VH370_10675 [Humisphaera sp.]|nr:hypothetical protein [Humisphaera sp.]
MLRRCLLLICVLIAAAFFLLAFRRWSRRTAIPFEATSTAGPAWGQAIADIDLSGRTLEEAIRDLAAASGARVATPSLSSAVPNSIKHRVPVGVRLRNVRLAQALNLVILLCVKDEDLEGQPIICREIDGVVYVCSARDVPRQCVARSYDVGNLLSSMKSYRASHPGFLADAVECRDMSLKLTGRLVNLWSVASVEDDLARFVIESLTDPSRMLMDEPIHISGGKMLLLQRPEVMDDIGRQLATLSLDRHEIWPARWRLAHPVADQPDPLAEVLPDVDLDQTDCAGALHYLNGISHTNIVVDWPDVAARAPRPDTKLNIHLHAHNITLQEVLDIILQRHFETLTSLSNTRMQVGYRVEDGIIVFAMRYWLDIDRGNLETRSYDVRRVLDNSDALSIAGEPDFKDGFHARHALDAAERLAFLLYTRVEPTSWNDRGGSGKIQHFYGRFLITQTPQVHERIRAFLDSMENSGQTPPKN